jgi:hypothetical protein
MIDNLCVEIKSNQMIVLDHYDFSQRRTRVMLPPKEN